MIRNHIELQFDFIALQKTLKALGISQEEASSLMGMTGRNFSYLKLDPSKLKIQPLLLLTNGAGVDLRTFLINTKDEALEKTA